MPHFHHNLMGIGELCDHNCRIFLKTTVTVFHRMTQSSSRADATITDPSCVDYPFDLNIIHQSHHIGQLDGTHCAQTEPDIPQHHLPPQCWFPYPLTPHRLGFPCQIHFYQSHRIIQLQGMVISHLHQRLQVLSGIYQITTGAFDPHSPGCTVHQTQSHPDHQRAPADQILRAPCQNQTHPQDLH